MKITKKSQIVKLWLDKKTIRDKNLNPADLNTFAALALLRHTISVFTTDGYIEFLPWSSKINAQHTVNASLEDVPDMSKQTIYNCLNKLNDYGYIDYAAGKNIKGGSGSKWARYRIKKGLKNMEDWDMSDLAPCSPTAATPDEEKSEKLLEHPETVVGSDADLAPCSPTESSLDKDFYEKITGQSDGTDLEQNLAKSDEKHLAPCSLTAATPDEEKFEKHLDSKKEINKEKDKEKEREKENALQQNADNVSLSSSLEFSDDEATPSENITNANPKNESNMKQDETKTTITKDELDNAALFYAVLRRAGWRSGDDWKSDLSYFRRKCSEVHGKGEDWTNRYAQRLDTIANTKVKDMYDDDIAKRVIPDFKAKAFRNVDKLLAERIEQHRRFSEKDYEYFQRITVSLCDGLRDTLWNRMAIRLTRRCNLLPDD